MDNREYKEAKAALMEAPEPIRSAVKVLCANRDAYREAYLDAAAALEVMTRLAK